MTAYYLEYTITSTTGEIYLLPCTLESSSDDEARKQSSAFAKELAAIGEIKINYGPKPLNDTFAKHIADRQRDREGHVQAGTLNIEQISFKPFGQLDALELEFVAANDGEPIVTHASTKMQLCRVLANPTSKPHGEVFALLLIGNSSLDLSKLRGVLGAQDDT